MRGLKSGWSQGDLVRVMARITRVLVGGILYLVAVWAVNRIGLLQSPTSGDLQMICLLAPGLVYGLVAGSRWALGAPALLAIYVWVTGTTAIENSGGTTWGEALAPVVFLSGAGSIALGLFLVWAVKDHRRAGR